MHRTGQADFALRCSLLSQGPKTLNPAKKCVVLQIGLVGFAESRSHLWGQMPRVALRNPQTVALFELLGLEYNSDGGCGQGGDGVAGGHGRWHGSEP